MAAKANLDASVENYDAVLVTLLGDVAQYYVTMRQSQEQIELARQNVKLQRDVLKIVQARFEAGTVTELDVAQQQTTLSQTEAQIPAFEIQLRQAQDQLCTLLGIPPTDLQARLGQRPIPTAPTEVVVGIPAQLLERRPDIRSAERAAAAQAQQIGIAQADLYPHISITGTLGYSAQNASQLFTPAAFNGSVGPSFTWNILNYGRLANNVRLQDAKFQQTLLDYRTAVLTANQEAEDGLVAFLKSQEQTKLLDRERGRRRQGLPDRRQPVSRGHGRLQPPRHPRNQPRAAAGSPGPGPRSDRLGPGPGLSGLGRRLGDPSRPAGGIRFAAAAARTRPRPRARPRARTASLPAPEFDSGQPGRRVPKPPSPPPLPPKQD